MIPHPEALKLNLGDTIYVLDTDKKVRSAKVVALTLENMGKNEDVIITYIPNFIASRVEKVSSSKDLFLTRFAGLRHLQRGYEDLAARYQKKAYDLEKEIKKEQGGVTAGYPVRLQDGCKTCNGLGKGDCPEC